MRPRRYTMRRLNVSIALVAALILPLAGLAAAGPAIASSAGSIYRECEVNGSITGHYSRAELQQALSHIPSEVAEYSDCQDLIQQAMLSASGPTHHGTGATAAAAGGNGRGGGSGKSSGGGRAGKTPAHSTRKGKKTDAGSSGAVTLAGSGIRPGSTGAAASTRSLPAALLVVLILLALTAVSGGAVAVRRRVVARNGT